MSLQIEILELSQIQQFEWLPLWEDYQKFYQTKLGSDITEYTWQRLASDDIQHIYGFAAIIDGNIVGIVHVIEHESCWTFKPYVYLQDLYTLESYRAKGVARALIQHVYQVAKQRQCDRVYWLTHESNEVAQHLYDRVARKTGFIQYRMH